MDWCTTQVNGRWRPERAHPASCCIFHNVLEKNTLTARVFTSVAKVVTISIPSHLVPLQLLLRIWRWPPLCPSVPPLSPPYVTTHNRRLPPPCVGTKRPITVTSPKTLLSTLSAKSIKVADYCLLLKSDRIFWLFCFCKQNVNKCGWFVGACGELVRIQYLCIKVEAGGEMCFTSRSYKIVVVS